MPSDGVPDIGPGNGVSHNDDNTYAGRVVTYRRIGVWDWYEEKDPDGVFAILPLGWGQKCSNLAGSFRYVVRAVKDLLSIPGCRVQFAIYVVTGLGVALIPAATIWYVVKSYAKILVSIFFPTGPRETYCAWCVVFLGGCSTFLDSIPIRHTARWTISTKHPLSTHGDCSKLVLAGLLARSPLRCCNIYEGRPTPGWTAGFNAGTPSARSRHAPGWTYQLSVFERLKPLSRGCRIAVALWCGRRCGSR